MLILYKNYSGMATGSKIRYFFISSAIVFLLVSCERNKNDVIPDVLVDFTIDLRDYPSLESMTGSAIVDANDMCIIVDHWGEDYPLCDVAPMPWGDGVVDVQDLIVLAEHLFEEFPPSESVEVDEADDPFPSR